MLPRWQALLLALLLLPGLARAGQTGQLRGEVSDGEGEPVEGVRVTLTSPQLIGGPRRTSTRADGRFRFPALEPGEYSVHLELPRAPSVQEEGLRIDVDAVLLREYRLEPGEAGEVSLTAPPPVVDTTSSSVSTSIGPELTDRLPTGRSYQSVALFAPGTLESAASPGDPSISGGAGFAHPSLPDGLNITDPTTNRLSTRFNFDAIQEVQVLSGGLDAEHGYATGGVVNVVTRSGGDEFTLDGSVFWQPRQLRLTEPGEGSEASDVNTNLAVGGPIIKRRLWFFLSSQYVDQQAVAPLGDLERPVFDDVPELPAYTYRGLYLLGKLKWQPVDWQRVTVFMQGDPTWILNERQSPTVHPAAERQRFEGGTHVGATSETRLHEDLVWETQVGYSASHLNRSPLSGDLQTPGHVNLATGVASVNDTKEYDDFRYRLQARSSLSYLFRGLLGEHELKLGVQGALAWQSVKETYPGGRIYYDNGLEEEGSSLAGAGDPYQVEIVTEPVSKLIAGNTVSAFVQDTWRPLPGFTLRPGLRFDSARAYNDVKDGGQKIYNLNWLSPRLGAAWDPFGDGKTVVRGGYFQYADMGMLSLAEYIGRDIGTETYAYNDDTGEYDQLVSRRGGEGAPVAKDNLRAPVMHELLVGIERELFLNAGVSAHVIYRRKANIWEDDERNVQWNEKGDAAAGFHNGRPEPRFSLGTPDGAFHQYIALQLSFDKRLANRWALLATYTLARLEGTVDELLGYSFDNPRQGPYEYGFLQDDVRHNARVSGSYELPLGVVVGGTAVYQSGRPYNRYAYNRFYDDYVDRRAPRGYDPGEQGTEPSAYKELRLQDQLLVSLRLLWGLEQLTGQRIELLADVFNVLSSRPVTRVEERDIDGGADFGKPLARGRPLHVQLGLRYRF